MWYLDAVNLRNYVILTRSIEKRRFLGGFWLRDGTVAVGWENTFHSSTGENDRLPTASLGAGKARFQIYF